MTSSDFMSFATGGMVLLAIGALLIPGLPSACTIVAVWAAALTSVAYIFALPDTEVLVRLIGAVPVVGLAAWLTIRPELHRLGWFVFQSGVFRWDGGGGVVVLGH